MLDIHEQSNNYVYSDPLGPVSFVEAREIQAANALPTYRHPRDHPRLVSWDLQARTEEARALSDHLAAFVINAASVPVRDRARLIHGVEAFVGSLFLGATTGSWSAQPTNTAAFSGLPIGAHRFATIRKALVVAGYVEELRGYYDVAFGGGACTKFRATPRLLDLGGIHGVAWRDAWRHFAWDTEKVREIAEDRLVVLRALDGNEKSLPASPEVERLIDEVRDFNAFTRGFSITYGPPHDLRAMAPQFQRIFTEHVGLHGRWYAAGGGYQSLPVRPRPCVLPEVLRNYGRGSLRIDGEPCVELDVRASYLTIIHGLAGVPLPPGGDPYAVVPGIPREVVKAWVSTRIGLGRAPSQWSDETAEDLRDIHGIDVERFSVGTVREGIVGAMPFLGRGLPALLGVADQPRLCSHVLMGIEARALTRAMLALKEQGILGLPLHDALIVQECHAEAAREALEAGYLAEAGIVPVVRVKRGVEGS